MPTSSKPGIFVVDDNALMQRVFVRALSQGYRVVTVGSAEEALERLRAGERFEAVVTDYQLPGMSGVELIEALTALDPTRALPVGIASGSLPTDSALPRGVPRLGKPFEVEELRAFVARLLAGG